MTVFFDFDGTVVDVRERHYGTYRSAVGALGGRPLSGSDYWRLKRRATPLTELLARSGLDGREGAYLEWFQAGVEAPASLALDRLLPGAERTLAGLARRGVRLVLLSLRRSPEAFRRQIDGLGIAGAFERVCSGNAHEDGARSKRHLIEQVGFGRPAAVVGDTEADVLAARALGLASVAVTTGLRNRGYLLRAGADVVVDRIGQAAATLEPGGC